MDTAFYIASRLRFKGKIAITCIAVSFLVMILAVAVSSGFRQEVRHGLSSLSGDIMISAPDLNVMGESRPVDLSDPSLGYVASSRLVEEMQPVVWRAGIVRNGEGMHGVLVKGVRNATNDTVPLGVSIPRKLAQASGLKPGDRMLTYFVGDALKMRQFNVVGIHETVVETDDKFVVYATLSDMQRLNGWDENQVSAVEVHLDDAFAGEDAVLAATQEIGSLVSLYQDGDDMVATSSVSRYPQLYSWLSLIDFNVGIILLLMTVVAGFNMISGLLILLFENISTIGILKSMGITDKSISKVFLTASARLVAVGMVIGNVSAFVICMIQKTTHVLKLNPENYYVSSVPVNVDVLQVLAADALSFVVIMLLLLIPCLFISKVDPAQTVRVR